MPRNQSSNNLPRNWPLQLPYLKNPSYSPNLTAEQRSSLRIKSQDAVLIPPSIPKGPCPLVKITQIVDTAHPACGQAGLFATKDLRPGSFIIEYLGVIHSSAPSTPPPPLSTTSAHQSPSHSPPISKVAASLNPSPATQLADPHATSNYDLSLSRHPHSLAVDAALSGNEARFINDYRGICDRPNAEFRDIWCGARQEQGIGVWVLPAGKTGKGKGGVRKGEEIVVSYGRGFWSARRGEGRVEAEDGTDGGGKGGS